MTRSTSHTIDVRSDETYEKLNDIAKKQNTSVRAITNQILEKEIQIKEIMDKKFEYLKIIDIDDDGMVCIKDKKRNQASLVQEIEGRINCNLCEKGSLCDHIFYALTSNLSSILKKEMRK